MTILYLTFHLLTLEPAVFVCPDTLPELGLSGIKPMHCPLALEILDRKPAHA